MTRTGNFWSDALGAPLVVLSDFDFTISQVDVGDLVTFRLSPPSPETLRRYRAGEIGTRLYWLDSMNRVDRQEGAALADQVAIDPHFRSFADYCRAESIPLAVVSDGFWFYISRILGREGLGDLPVFCNEMPEPGRLAFPHGNPACDRCGCCKAGVVRRLKEAGAHVLYAGDGVSDLYAVGFADWIFAKGHLAEYLEKQGSSFYPLNSFADLQQTLSANLAAFRDGTAPRRASLGAHRFCKF